MLRLDDFKCTSCGYVFEQLVRKNSSPHCTKCGEPTKKLIGSPDYFGNTVGKSPSTNKK